MEANRTLTQAESAELECETLAGLMQTDEFRSTVYAFLDLVQKRSKRPAGAPPIASLPAPPSPRSELWVQGSWQASWHCCSPGS